MKLFSLTAVCLLLVAIEAALLHVFGASIVRADVAVAVVVFFALRGQALEGAAGSFFAGYFMDVLSGQPSGLYMFTAVVTWLVGRFIAPFVDVRSGLGFGLLLLVLDALHNALAYALVWFGSAQDVDRAAMWNGIPRTAALTAVAGFAIWKLLKRIDGAFAKPETGGIYL